MRDYKQLLAALSFILLLTSCSSNQKQDKVVVNRDYLKADMNSSEIVKETENRNKQENNSNDKVARKKENDKTQSKEDKKRLEKKAPVQENDKEDIDVKAETVTEKLPFETIEIENASLPLGERTLIQEGKAGTIVKRVVKTYKSGKLIEEKVEIISKTDPISAQYAKGTKRVYEPYYDYDFARAVFEAINEKRIENELPPLVWDERLTNSAHVRAQEISYHFSHSRPDGSPYSSLDPNYINGENLAQGYLTVHDAIVAWTNSDSHLYNYLGDYSYTGVSVYVDEIGMPHISQLFKY